MNSAEEISKYKETIDTYYSPTLSRRLLGYGYDFPEKSPKKDKKWSIGSLFRRKKKEESESSSEEESKRGFLGRKKKKSDKTKKKKTVGTFDHVVLSRNSYLYSNGFNGYEEPAIFSDPSYTLPIQDSPKLDEAPSRTSSAGDSSKKKKLAKVRAEARRVNLRRDSSSDEDSQRSASSSRFRSDDSLRDSSLSRRSRAARTERYFKRHSRDGENPKDYLRLSKSDVENSILWRNEVKKEKCSQTGLSTIPPSHGSRIRVSNSTSNPSYKPPSSMNDYNNRKSYENLDRSVSCEANIHKAEPEVIHVQFPIGKANARYRNLSLVEVKARQPPPPPPRDPRRLVTAHYYDRPTSYVDKSKSFHTPPQTKKFSFNLAGGRSTSEDHLPKSNIQLIPRPSSATPERCQRYPESYNYLTDKKPRSRKPIFIQTSKDDKTAPKALDFWKQKDRDCSFQEKVKSPQMFTCQTHVQTKVFLPSVLHNDLTSVNSNSSNDKEESEEMKRKSSNLEEALDELEAIYNSLRLGDEDLLERAEQREKDAAAKKLKEKCELYPKWVSRGALSDSGFSYEPFDSVDSPRRKKLIRKSQTIDRRADDMAFRKLNKERSATINDPQSVLSRVSYLNASPVYGRDVAEPNGMSKNSKEPDITLDDVVYRNVKFANSTPKVVEPQPPFGIPIGPVAPAPNSDYLHAVPDNIQRPTFKPRKIPDLVKDDLAFRNLRKDESKEPALPQLSPDDLKNNNAGEKLDLNSLKKKRAVRSLSANIGSLINRDLKYRNNNSDDESKTLTDIADAMEIARQVLKEQENKITATRRAFLSDTDTSNGNEKIAESRMNFLNSLKTPGVVHPQGKPPRGLTPDRRSPKESTPIPFEEKKSRDSSLDDLLSALATEARETNERINKELTFDDENLNSYELKKTLSDIDAVSEQAKLCEKLLEGVVDSTELMDSDKALEEVEPVLVESVANVVVEKKSEKLSESDHDYENLMSDEELNLEIEDEEIKCTSPFEEHKAELIASFQELKKNVDLDLPDEEEAGEACVVARQVCVPNPTNCDTETNLDSLESLKSPRLVLETSKLTSRIKNRSVAEDDPEASEHIPDEKPTPAWYRDPTTVAVACSYGLACAHQLASLDFVAILGVLFAVLSFIAALIF